MTAHHGNHKLRLAGLILHKILTVEIVSIAYYPLSPAGNTPAVTNMMENAPVHLDLEERTACHLVLFFIPPVSGGTKVNNLYSLWLSSRWQESTYANG